MQKANEEEKQSRENAYEYKDVYGTIRKLKTKRKIEKKNAVQSFGDCSNAVPEPAEAVHSTLKEV